MKIVYKNCLLLAAVSIFLMLFGCTAPEVSEENNLQVSNPLFPGWYADPEVAVVGDSFWIFPTYSAAFKDQLFFDAFSSSDLMRWNKHERILDTADIRWARQAMWAPSMIEKNGRYFLFFGANDIQRPGRASYDPDNDINHFGGIGIAVADHPGGPYRDYLGQPLIDTFYHDAQPIDQFVFRDTDDTDYIFYGGWGHCNLGRLNADYTGLIPWDDGQLFHEITPEGYVEGPFMFKRKGVYYFMWSEGNWTDDTYTVAYATASKVTGPYERRGTILSSDPDIATGAGHHSVLHIPDSDTYYMVYHRRPIPNEGRDHRVTCLDRLIFDDQGLIESVKITRSFTLDD